MSSTIIYTEESKVVSTTILQSKNLFFLPKNSKQMLFFWGCEKKTREDTSIPESNTKINLYYSKHRENTRDIFYKKGDGSARKYNSRGEKFKK